MFVMLIQVNDSSSSSSSSGESESRKPWRLISSSKMASQTTTMRTSTEGPSGASMLTKTTTYETRSSSSYVAESEKPSYRSQIAPRTYVIQRTAVSGLGSAAGGSSMSRSMERSAQMGALQAGAPAGIYLNIPYTRSLHVDSTTLYTHTCTSQ